MRAWAPKMAPYCGPSLAVTASWLTRVSRAACGQGLLQPRAFRLDLIGGNKPLRDAEPFGVQHQGWADGHAGRDGDAAFDFHVPRKRSAIGVPLVVC